MESSFKVSTEVTDSHPTEYTATFSDISLKFNYDPAARDAALAEMLSEFEKSARKLFKYVDSTLTKT